MTNFDMCTFKSNTVSAMRLCIAVIDETGRQHGELGCLDQAMVEDEGLLEDLTTWRNAARTSFLTQFDAKPEKTSAWIRNVVLTAPERMLFIIRGNDGDRVGHIGISNISAEKVEIDNVMRGRRSSERDIMFYSGIALLSWLFTTFKMPVAQLHVLSQNLIAIKLYKKLGFKEVERMPLWRIQNEDMIRYSSDSKEGENAGFDYIRMEISASRFRTLHSWI